MGSFSVINIFNGNPLRVELHNKGNSIFRKVILLIIFTFITPNNLQSQIVTLVELERISEPINLDGVVDELVWQKIQPVKIVMHQPIFGEVPSEKTEIRFAYDNKYLYASGRFYDSNPEEIRGNSLERDDTNPGDDGFGIILDTFNDNENALCFAITPAGIRGDWTIINDAETTSGSPINQSWNTYWDAEVVQNDKGWFVEVRIPFSSLRFQEAEKIIMGLITWRYIPRKNEIDIYPAIPPNWELSFLKPSVAQDIAIEGIKSKSPLYITPYILSGFEQSSELNNSETAYYDSKKSLLDLGLDLKYGISSDLTLDVTINTDFAQVEADEPQINFTRFSLFFPEKRLFFQERAGLFNFSFGGQTKMFYTRRIGLYDIGDNDFRQIPIYAGTRLAGKIGEWDVGFLDMQTASKDFKDEDYEDSTVTVPSENFGVLRLRRQVLNPYSYIGTMFTSRLENGGEYNYCYGFDGTIRLSDNDYFTFSVAQSSDSQESPSNILDANRMRLTLEKRSKQGFGYNLYFVRRGPDYAPRMGFEVWENYYANIINLSYSWLPKETSSIFRNTITLENYFLFSNSDDKLESSQFGPIWTYEGKKGSSGKLWIKGRFEGISDTLDLPEDVFVPPDDYLFYEAGMDYNMSSGNLLRTNVSLKGGPFYDGTFFSVGISPHWIISKHITIGGNYQPTWAEFSNRGQSFITHILSLRANIAFNTKFSTNTFILFNSAADAAGINFRLRYNPKEGTDFYLVYNEGFNIDRERELPNLPLSARRSVLLKYSITFIP